MGFWRATAQLFESVQVPDGNTYRLMLELSVAKQKWRAAVQLLQLMWSRSFAPTVAMYASAMDVCERCGQWTQVLRFMEDMRNHHLTPDRDALSIAMRVCGSAAQALPSP